MTAPTRQVHPHADTVGVGGLHTDPLWGTVTTLTPLELALLRTWPVRRLGHVAHAGAVATVTTQTFSRLEHSLGVLGLVAHLDGDDAVTRAAALLHDVGHAPLSHTLEGIAGIDHHVTGMARVRALSDLLGEHGVDVDDVVDTLSGARRSALRPRLGLVTLDHLDGYVRSARAHGRRMPAPPRLLRRLTLQDGVLRTDPAGARVLAQLVDAEVAYHRSPLNVLAVGVVRHLVRRWLEPGADADAVVGMTDGELVAALLRDPRTGDETRHFLTDPLAWCVVPARPGPAPEGVELVPGGRSYHARALVHGEPLPDHVPVPDRAPDRWVLRRDHPEAGSAVAMP
ncbi:HD domain-containing protein [Cellulomonas sp. NPDC057328]|uniref:HD domain-containing protein n=1 Tax=Cellulomonas sp. NPDC057328 TaxID=3346101 RepID=UPI0036353255